MLLDPGGAAGAAAAEPEAAPSTPVARGAFREEDADLSCLGAGGAPGGASTAGFLRAPDLPRANVLKYSK